VNASAGYDHDQWLMDQEHMNGAFTNGHAEPADDPMDVDSNTDNYGWEGASSHDRPALQSLLAGCLEASV